MRLFFVVALVAALALSALAANNNDDLKAQFDSVLKVLNGQLSPVAKAKVGGDLMYKIGNVGTVNLTGDDAKVVAYTPENALKLQNQMKAQMERIGMKMKIPSEPTKARVMQMLGMDKGKEIERINKQPAYMWYQNDKFYLTGLLVMNNSVKSVGEATRKAEVKALQDAGVLVNGDVLAYDELSVLIPMDNFSRVLEMNIVKRFKADRPYTQNLNASVPEIGANTVWNRAVSPATGTGVVVGVIDDGISLTHADFQIAANNSRILFLWDQTVTGTFPTGYTYGNECTKAQIDAGSCSQTITAASLGHGTHTIGIAAGDGSTGAGVYTGVAPGADIVYVKIRGSLNDFYTTAGTSRLWDAMKYIRAKAVAAGKPAAISLSYGYQGGPHDGFADTDWLIDQGWNSTTAGQSLSISAGNDGQNNLHTDALICPDGTTFDLRTQVSGPGYPWYTIDSANRSDGPNLVWEFYYPANKNVNVSVAMPVYLDVTSAWNCRTGGGETWYTLYSGSYVPELDNVFTNDAKPNVWGVTYQWQKNVTASAGSWLLCDSPIGDINGRNSHYMTWTILRDSDCTQKNNGHGTLTRCNTAITPGGCDYHLDNELAPGTDAIFVVFTPAVEADTFDRAATGTNPRGCGAPTSPNLTCAHDLWHCSGAGFVGAGSGLFPCSSSCSTCYNVYPTVIFSERDPAATDVYGDGGCFSACNTRIAGCTGIAQTTSQQTMLEGWIENWYMGWWYYFSGTTEECTTYYLMEGDSLKSIGEPSSAQAAIAAAAYTTKADTTCNPTDVVGDRPLWSSPGPMRSGTPAASWYKPEISAPGNVIGSAMPTGITPDCPITGYPNYQLMGGTSMASPHIAGTAALLFQCCPTLTLGQVKSLLDDNALDAGTAGFDTDWGWGKLRANAAYLDLLPAFAGIQSATPAGATQINLAWNAATVDECPTGASYDIHRIQGACPFTPAVGNRIATGITALTYSNTGLTTGLQYSYIVRAVEGNHCTEDNVVCLSATPTGGGLPGEVPQKSGAGSPLTITKSGTNLAFTWGAPGGTCLPTQYEIYRGTLPWTAYNHGYWTCTISGTTYTGIQDTGSYYYLVVAATATQEGSYGKSSPAATERPIGAPQCSGVTQILTAC